MTALVLTDCIQRRSVAGTFVGQQTTPLTVRILRAYGRQRLGEALEILSLITRDLGVLHKLQLLVDIQASAGVAQLFDFLSAVGVISLSESTKADMIAEMSQRYD